MALSCAIPVSAAVTLAGKATFAGKVSLNGGAASCTTPVISNVSSNVPAATTCEITWTTDQNTTNNVVDYGTSTSYGSTVLDNTSGTSHSNHITGLTASTLYHFRVRDSSTCNGTSATNSDSSFTTATSGNGLLTSLTAVWDMEQADASNAADATGGGFTLTVHGATSRRTTHIEGSFANSGGPSAYWDTSSSTLKTTGSFSIAMWFNTQSLNDDGAFIIERWNGTTPVWALYDNSGVITFFIRNSGNSGNYSAASTVAVNNNNWHLVVFTYNSSTKVGKISIDNETLVASATTDGLNTDTRNFTLGATVFYMDETAYWDGRVLSQSDIGTIYASGAGLFYSGGGWTN